MLYAIGNEFVKINETRGIIQNTSSVYTVEISDDAVPSNSFILYPLNHISFTGNIYLRCIDGGGRAQVNVVSFITDSGGISGTGDGSTVDDSQVASDDDIDSLIDDIFG